MTDGPKQFSLRTLVLAVTLLCLGFGLVAAFPYAALAIIYFVLFPLSVFVMVSLIVGVLVLGRFLIEKIRN